MRTHAWLVVAAGLLVAADARDDAIQKDKAALRGTWQVTALEERGEVATAAEIQRMRMVFSDDKLVIKGLEEGKDLEAAYFLDPTQKPAAIDVIPAEGDEKGKKVLAIYVIDQDVLKICAAQKSGQERPKGFVTAKEAPYVLISLKRQNR